MANTNLGSIQVTDFAGKSKSIPLYFPTGMTLANIQAGLQAFATDADAAIDGLITKIEVTLALPLPSGLKTSAGSNRVREGALLDYVAANTIYHHGIFIPSWSNEGFTGDVVNDTGVYDTFIQAIVNGVGTSGNEVKPADKYANDLTSYVSGERKFRK